MKKLHALAEIPYIAVVMTLFILGEVIEEIEHKFRGTPRYWEVED